MATSCHDAVVAPEFDEIRKPGWLRKLKSKPADINKVWTIFHLYDSCGLRMALGNDLLGHVTGCPGSC
jgi:hypothetical protein